MNESFIQQVDDWIKKFEKDSYHNKNSIIELLDLTHENIENTQHNYELIYELKDQIEEIKDRKNSIIKILEMQNQIEEQKKDIHNLKICLAVLLKERRCRNPMPENQKINL